MFRDLLTILSLFRRAAFRPMLGGVLLATLTALAGVALLGLSGWFITATGIAGAIAATALAFDTFRPGAGVRFLALLRTGGRYAERLVTHEATLAVIATLRVRMFRAAARPGLARALIQRPGRLLFRITGDLDALDTLYLRLAVPLSVLVLLSLAVAAGLWFLIGLWGPLMALVLLGTGILLLVWLAQASWGPGGQRAILLETLRLRLLDLTAGRVDWRMVGRLGAMADLTLDADRRLTRADERLNRMEVISGLVQSLVGTGLLTGGLLLAAWMVGDGWLEAGGATLAVLTSMAMVEPLAPLRRGGVELGRLLRAARRVAADLAPTPPITVPSPPTGLAVQIDRMHFRHDGAAIPLFNGLSLSIPSGQHVALIGGSGAGKSSLIALLTGEATPQSGSVAALDWALMDQRVDLFQDDIRANLRLADPAADDDRLWQVLHLAGLERVVREMPAGLDSPLTEGGAGLSSGQRRRLALARFLLQDKPLWLLDEVTDGIDLSVAGEILTKLKELGANRTILIVTHLRREAALADRLIRVQGGNLVTDAARGTPAFEEALATLRPD